MLNVNPFGYFNQTVVIYDRVILNISCPNNSGKRYVHLRPSINDAVEVCVEEQIQNSTN